MAVITAIDNTGDTLLGTNGSDVLTGKAGHDDLYGEAGDDRLSGAGGDDQIYADTGDDHIYGGLGRDLLYGGAGSDTFYFFKGDGQDQIRDTEVAEANDRVVLGAGLLRSDLKLTNVYGSLQISFQGNSTDTLTLKAYFGISAPNHPNAVRRIEFDDGSILDLSTMLFDQPVYSYADPLGDFLEGYQGRDWMIGRSGDDSLDGHAGNDWIKGMAGSDDLFGGDGHDTLEGGSQNDTLYGGIGNDVLDGGTENDSLSGAEGDDQLKGAAGNDLLTGGAGHDVLDGGAGRDEMSGDAGDDTYYVDSLLDIVQELAGLGADHVISRVNYQLGDDVEHLTLIGNALNATGNWLGNKLKGNSLNNVLDGQAGNDVLMGGLGNDSYRFARGYGKDTIVENDTSANQADQLVFLNNIKADQLWFKQVQQDLEVTVIGSTDRVVVKNWYAGAHTHVEQFVASDGRVLADTAVQNLVNAMAGLTMPAQGYTELSTAQHAQLDHVIQANWLTA